MSKRILCLLLISNCLTTLCLDNFLKVMLCHCSFLNNRIVRQIDSHMCPFYDYRSDFSLLSIACYSSVNLDQVKIATNR